MVPLNTELKTGDVVELKTNKNSSPSEDWLKIVKTKQARSKINTFFQKKELEEKAESIKLGEEYFEEAFKKENLNPKDFLTKDKLEKIYSEFAVKNYNDLMFAIGVKSLSPYSIIEKLVKTGKKELDKTALTTMITKNKSRQKRYLNMV